MAILLQPVYSQQVEYALTVEECRAEQTLWMSRLDEPNDAGTVNVNYSDLNDWSSRMLLCGSVDPDLHWQYYNTQRELSEVQTNRLTRFLVRHNFYGKFLAEDAQGSVSATGFGECRFQGSKSNGGEACEDPSIQVHYDVNALILHQLRVTLVIQLLNCKSWR